MATGAPASIAGLRERMFDAAGVRLRCVEAGTGAPVVLLHSFLSNVEAQWVDTGILPALARDYRVLAFDARGHGRSDKPRRPEAYGEELAWDVVRLLDHLALPAAHVVGYSLGAHVAAQLLTLAPQRLTTVTLGGAAGRRTWGPADDIRTQAEADALERGCLAAQIRRLHPSGRPAPTPADLAARTAALLAGQDRMALAALRRASARQQVTTMALAAAEVPVLGIVGSDDPYRASFEELAAAMPRMALTVIPGADHDTAPATPAFLAALARFLSAHAAR